MSSDKPDASFTWQPGNLNGSQQTITADSNFNITVIAIHEGCSSAPKTFNIQVKYGCQLEVPNVFTPNDDGNNDYFQLIGYEGIKTIQCTIFNRWGNTIQFYNTPDFKWDGKDQKGQEVSDGTFFYTINYENFAGESHLLQGFIHKKSN